MRIFAEIFSSRRSIPDRVSSLEDRLEDVERKLGMLSMAMQVVERNRDELQAEAISIRQELNNIHTEVPVSFVGDIK